MNKRFIPWAVRNYLREATGLARLDAELGEKTRLLGELQSRLDRLERGAVPDLRCHVADLGDGIRDGLAAQAERLEALDQNHAALAGRLDKLRDRVLRHSRIDIINMGGIKLFMYTDDASYRVLPEAERHYQLSASDYRTSAEAPAGRTGPYFCEAGTDENLTTTLLEHYWDVGLDFTLLDVGASYGFESIYTAHYVRRRGRANRVVAFEPGVAGALLEHNVVLNQVADLVTVERAAISNFTGPMLLFGEDGHSENNRIVNRWLDGEDLCFVTAVDALDAYAARRGIDTHFIVKVDTQGGEPEVLEGMASLFARGTTTLITEFSPTAIVNRMAPRDFLAALARVGTVCDLGQQGPLASTARCPLAVVSEAEFDGLGEVVRARPYEWSDLLVVPHGLPRRDELLAALTGGREVRAVA